MTDPYVCPHEDTWFDRTLCACGMMHTYCDDCGRVMGWCPYSPSGLGR